MKNEGHPPYFVTTVRCGCGNSFTTRSTQKELKVDICSSCHPYFTGTQKHLDAAGRIEKFRSKYSAEGKYASLDVKKRKKPAAQPAGEDA